MEKFLLSYWWIFLIVMCLVLYRVILRFLFGMVIVPEDRIGLVTKKFVLFGANKELPDGRILAIIKLIPDVLIGGNNNGGSAMDGLLGLKLMEMMDPQKKSGSK